MKSTFYLLAATFAATAAFAASVSFEVEVVADEALIPRFDPSQGWLQGIEVELLDYNVTNTYLLDNDNPHPVEAHFSHAFPIQLMSPIYEGGWSFTAKFLVERDFSASLGANNGDRANEQNGGADELQLALASSYGNPISITNKAYLGESMGDGFASYRVMRMGTAVQTDDGVEYRHVNSSGSGHLRVTYLYDLPATNPWYREELSNVVDRLFHDGSRFVASTFGKSTQHVYSNGTVTTNLGYEAAILTTENGQSWQDCGAPPDGAIAFGHNGQGGWYSLKRTSYYNGWSTTYMLNLLSSSNGTTWQDHGEIFRSSSLVPGGASFCANDGVVLIRQSNGWGAGWSSGFPPSRAYLLKESSQTIINWPDGEAFSQFHCSDGVFYAIKDYSIFESRDQALSWSPVCGIPHESPVGSLHTVFDDRFFVSGSFSRFNMLNRLGEGTQLPAPFEPNFTNPIVDFEYNGRHAVLLARDAFYYSDDHMASWKVYIEPGLEPKQVARDEHRFVVHARKGNASIMLMLASQESGLQRTQSVPLGFTQTNTLEVDRFGATNRVKKLTLEPHGDSNVWNQIELSRNLIDWAPFGMPTRANDPVDFRISDSPSTSLFFRVRGL